MSRILLFVALAIFTFAAPAATYYVRTDGGTSAQCTGLADAAYSGKGAAQACAWNNPQWGFPPGSSGDGVAPMIIKDGDTMIVGPGSYQFGYGSPGAGACQTAYTYNCVLISPRKMPSNFTIKGSVCGNGQPVIWGSGHQYQLFNFTGTSNDTISCLELTDHSNCLDDYTGSAVPKCVNNGTTYASAQDGIDATDATNLTLDHLNIHGLTTTGVLLARINGLTLDTVTLRANGGSGFNGDVNGTDSDSGTILIKNSLIAWNGCTENYPATTIVACHGASQGGYGDGLGTGLTGGKWVIQDSTFSHNTSDGLDLLYADGTGSILVDHVSAMYNAGQQIKVSAPATVQNSVVIGACDELGPYGLLSSELCRAAGNAVEIDFTAANQSQTFTHNTITGNGDCLVVSGPGSANTSYVPDSSNAISMTSDILLGQVSYLPKNSGGQTCAFYSNGAPKVTWTTSIVWNTRNTDFTTPGMLHVDPLLQDESLPTFNPTPASGSPALGTGTGAVQP